MRSAASGLLTSVRRLARELRHTPDRLMHGRRRRSAAQLERPRVVLFVCYGNICRSPYAEVAFRQVLDGDDIVVQSAGFTGPGREVPDKGQRVAARHGVPLAEHRSRQLTPELVQGADLIVVMSPQQRQWLAQRFGRREGVVLLGDFDPQAIDTRTVVDPVDQSEAVFEAVYTRIDRCVRVLADVAGNAEARGAELPLRVAGGGHRPG